MNNDEKIDNIRYALNLIYEVYEEKHIDELSKAIDLLTEYKDKININE